MPWTHPQPDGARFSIRPHTAMIFLASRDNFGNGFQSVSSIWCRELPQNRVKSWTSCALPEPCMMFPCKSMSAQHPVTLYRVLGRTTSRNHRMIWCIRGVNALPTQEKPKQSVTSTGCRLRKMTTIYRTAAEIIWQNLDTYYMVSKNSTKKSYSFCCR